MSESRGGRVAVDSLSITNVGMLTDILSTFNEQHHRGRRVTPTVMRDLAWEMRRQVVEYHLGGHCSLEFPLGGSGTPATIARVLGDCPFEW